jgi:hypothetical protein
MTIHDTNLTNDNDETLVSETINVSVVQAVINPAPSAGLTVFANINNTVGGNLTGRKTVRVFNRGKRVRWRINGQLTGSDGEDIGKGEALEFTYGENIVIELREQNTDNEIDVIITETK